jgi:hypothetical protein
VPSARPMKLVTAGAAAAASHYWALVCVTAAVAVTILGSGCAVLSRAAVACSAAQQM